jgi:hypothetical protein
MGEEVDATSLGSRMVGRRNVVAGIAALGGAGVFGVTRAAAQDDPDDDSLDDEDDLLEMAPEIGEAYQSFVAKLAANLGEGDVTVVDAAIRDALAAMVEERFAAGEISRNLADELIERIQTGEAPLAVALIAAMRGRRMERRKRRWDDDGDASEESSVPNLEATPTI